MSLLVTAALVAGGYLFGRWVTRGPKAGEADGDDARDPNRGSGSNGHAHQAAGDERERHDRSDARSKSRSDDAPPSESDEVGPSRAKAGFRQQGLDGPDILRRFPCQLGDVLLRTAGDEAWLAGALVFIEEVPVSALFIAPDAGGDHAIFVTPSPEAKVTWLEILPAAALGLDRGPAPRGIREPPSAVEHDGLWFERVRRIPVRIVRLGTGAPDLGDEGLVAEYAASGTERIVVVSGAGTSRAYRGVALEEGLYEIISAGKATLS